MYLQWCDQKYATGIAEIDEQHKELFTRINSLLVAMKEGKGKEEVAKILAFLEQYVVNHFHCEERHMERTRCSACAANKTAHQQFLKDFIAFKKTFEEKGPSALLIIEVQRKLCDWLTNHIAGCDSKLREVTNVYVT